ncbi:MAG: carboxy terminal-processing peptidase, partial [Bacteroidia bacterium]
MGSVKVTVQKFYRINGGTTQLVGVTPDVVVPDAYDNLEMGEKEQKFAMQYDKIKPADYMQFNDPRMNPAIESARQRLASSAHYAIVKQHAAVLDARRKQVQYPLSYARFAEMETQRTAENRRFNDTAYKTSLSDWNALQADLQAAGGDEAKTAQRKDWIKAYRRDAMLEQAVLLLTDWLP